MDQYSGWPFPGAHLNSNSAQPLPQYPAQVPGSQHMVPVPPHMLHMLVSAPVPYHNYMPAPPAYPAGSTQRATKEARASLEKKRLRNRVNQAKLRVREKKQNSTDREELTYLRKYVKDLDVQLEEAKNKMLKYESETPEPPRKRIIRTTSIETTSDAGSSGCPNSVAVSGSEDGTTTSL